MKNFVSPHVHIQSLDSASTPEAFAKRELELETGALVVTDHGVLGACRKVYDLGKAKGLTPIAGIEAYFRDDTDPLLTAAGYPKNSSGAFTTAPKYSHITMHALDQPAYECMVKLLSAADARLEGTLSKLESKDRNHGQERKPLFNWADLEELGGHNITMTSGCLIGIVPRHLLDNDDGAMANAYFDRIKSIVKPGNFFVELFPHDCSKNWVEGVFLTMADGTKLRFYTEKWLRTDAGDIQAAKLAKAWKDGEHHVLKSIKDRNVWREMPEQEIKSVAHVEDFLQNECRKFAPNGDLQAGINRFMRVLAKRNGVKCLPSDDSHYAYPQDSVVQNMRLAQSGSWRFFGDYSRQSSEQAFEHFKKTLGTTEKEMEEWVDNSREWADRFKGFVFDTPVSIPTKFYDTQYELQPWFKEQGHPDNSVKYTMDLIRKHGRMDWKDPVRVARLRAEINLLHSNGKLDLLPYMFLGEEVCSQYEQAGLLVGPGRGSAAGLGLAYLLGITHVDPIKYGLSMDRFLTADRIRSGKMPDIDIDFPNRDLLVNPVDGSGWLKERFGDHFAQLSVDITLRLKMAMKDMARTNHQRCDTCSKTYNKSTMCCGHTTKGFVPPDIEIITKKLMMPPMGVNDLDFALGYDTDEGHMQGSVEYDPALQDYIKRYPQDWEVVQKAIGLARSKGRHACSFVVANKPISSFIPLTTVSGVRVTSYTAASVEAVGGLKMDYLVVTVLSDISDAIKMIQDRSRYQPDDFKSQLINGRLVPGHRIVPVKVTTKPPFDPDKVDSYSRHDIWDLPEDQAVFADIATGKTETVFQFSTPGAKQWLEQFSYKKPNGNYAIDSIEGMAAFTALDRPGPLDARVTNPEDGSKHNLLVEYARRARGALGSKEVLPVFDRLLPETYGVVVFQESIEKMYREITGCSGSEAEGFRTLVAKKQMDKLQKLYTPFIEAASKTLGKEDAEAIWAQWIGFGAYSFNKSHAVCYSVIGYACAWLKHHYPLEWWTAVLRNADKNEISEKFWRHAGHLIDLPDLKLSGGKFEIQNERIRAPVSLLHGIGEAASNQLIAGMPYSDVNDFCQKIEKHRQATGEWITKPKNVKKNKRKDPETKKFVYDEVVEDVRTFKKGHSSLHSGVIKTLILSGAMDSLFPPEMHVGEQFVEYERAFAEAVNASAEITGTKKVKPKKVDPKDWDLDPIQRYQKRKEILPAYSTDLIKLLFQVNVTPDLQIDQISGLPVFLWIPPHSEKTVALSVVGAKEVDRLSGLRIEEGRSIQVAVCAHVDDARVFRYGEERKEACELQLDVDGARYKYVRWSGKEGSLPPAMKVPLKGAVVVAVLNRFRDLKPFAISDVVIVRPPLEDGKEETKEEGDKNENDTSSTS